MKHFFHFKHLIDLSQVKDIIKAGIAKQGGNKSDISRKLGISPQLLGQYERGRQKPKSDFYKRWRQVFGEDLLDETNVSVEQFNVSGIAEIIKTAIQEYVDKYIDEKEARRQETEARLIIADKEKNRLFNLLETRLSDLAEGQGTMLAYQKAWVDQHAEEIAKGDQVVEKQIKAKMSRRVGEHELGPVNKDKH